MTIDPQLAGPMFARCALMARARRTYGLKYIYKHINIAKIQQIQQTRLGSLRSPINIKFVLLNRLEAASLALNVAAEKLDKR